MKSTKTLLAVALGGLVACGAALAQNSTNTPSTNAPPRQFAPRGPNIDRLAQFLGLTDDQKAKVKAILEQRMEKRRDIMMDDTLSREEKMDKMRALNDDVNAKMKQVLTPDQFDKWQKTQMHGRRPPMQPPPGGTNAPASTGP